MSELTNVGLIVVNVGLLLIGFALGVWWFSAVVLSLFYGLPRALYWAARGWCQWRAPLLYVASPVFWNVALLVIAFILVTLAPRVAAFLYTSWGFNLGATAGIVISLFRTLFSPSTRHDMRCDFADWVSRYLTEAGTARLEHLRPSYRQGC